MYRQVPGIDAVVGIAASGALDVFTTLELEGRYRVNVVSPTIVNDSVDECASLFPGLSSVSMVTLVGHYVDSIDGDATGRIIRAYG